MKLKRLFIAPPGQKPGAFIASVNMLIAAALVCAVFWASLSIIGLKLDFGVLSGFGLRIRKGFLMTVELCLASLLASLVLGSLAAIGQGSRLMAIKYLCTIYVQFIRGTPLIMQIYLFYYIIGTAWGVTSRFWAGVVILSMFEGAYISEILRGSMLSMQKTQLEAAKAVGFTKAQTMRYVTLPQLTARTLPALTGQFASLIKDSSLLSMIAVIELTQTMREITAVNFRMFECYLLLGLLYLALTLPLSFISKRLERRFSYEHHD